jgi:hypothetical protein
MPIIRSLLISTLLVTAVRAESRIEPGPWAGPLHKKYAGKVVFSSRPIPMDGKDDRAVYRQYTLGDPLYIRYWSADSPHNLMPSCDKPRIISRADVNGRGAGKNLTELDSFALYDVDTDKLDERKMASLSNELELAFTTPTTLDPSSEEEAGRQAVRLFNAQFIPQLHDGANEIRVIVSLDCGYSTQSDPVLAEGTLNVTVKPGAVAAYLTKYGTRLASSPFSGNRAVVRDIIVAMKKESDWRDEKIVGAQVTAEDWTAIHNEVTGRLVAKQIEAIIVARANKASAEECRLFHMSFRRDAAGGALYRFGTGDSEAFACSNAPK